MLHQQIPSPLDTKPMLLVVMELLIKLEVSQILNTTQYSLTMLLRLVLTPMPLAQIPSPSELAQERDLK